MKTPHITGGPVFGTPLFCKITNPGYDEYFPTAFELPTSEPATAQIQVTLAAAHLPTFEGVTPGFYIGLDFHSRGQNLSGSARTVSYRFENNGASIATGTSASIANNYYARTYFQRGAVSAASFALGDVVGLKLWANGAGVWFDRYALQGRISRLKFPVQHGNLGVLLLAGCVFGVEAVKFESAVVKPSWCSDAGSSTPSVLIDKSGGTGAIASPSFSASNMPCAVCQGQYGFYRCSVGDVNGIQGASGSSSASTSVSTEKRITQIWLVPTAIKW